MRTARRARPAVAGLVAGIVLVVGTAGAGVVAAEAAAPAPSTSGSRLSLPAQATGSVDASDFVDADGNGAPSAGDRLVQHEVLRSGGHVLGELTTSCDVATATRAVCTLVWRLPGGLLTGTTQATDDLTAPLQVAVTGGTGDFRTAAGMVRVVNDPAAPGSRDTQYLAGVMALGR